MLLYVSKLALCTALAVTATALSREALESSSSSDVKWSSGSEGSAVDRSAGTSVSSSASTDPDVFTMALKQEDLTVAYEPSIVNRFTAWMEEHTKSYPSFGEELYRMRIWLSNHELIEAHNNQTDPRPSYTLGHNEYSDMTHDEFLEYFSLGPYSPGVPSSIFGGGNGAMSSRVQAKVMAAAFEADMKQSGRLGGKDAAAEERRARSRRRLNDEADDENVAKPHIPKTKDWRADGGVLSVKNQGKCGSCWAFSATGAIEGSMHVQGFPPRNLSVEELVDCDKSELGCSGGLMDSAFITEEGWGGMCSWEDYPYDAPDHPHDLTCRKTNCTSVEGSAILSFIDVSPAPNTPCTEDDLMAAIAAQPVAVAIQANQLAFMFYNGGILDATCGASLDHGVLAVGYGEEVLEMNVNVEEDDEKDVAGASSHTQKAKYWIVKNSWGETWGEQGYIRIARQSDAFDAPDEGQCGILMMASYPEV